MKFREREKRRGQRKWLRSLGIRWWVNKTDMEGLRRCRSRRELQLWQRLTFTQQARFHKIQQIWWIFGKSYFKDFHHIFTPDMEADTEIKLSYLLQNSIFTQYLTSYCSRKYWEDPWNYFSRIFSISARFYGILLPVWSRSCILTLMIIDTVFVPDRDYRQFYLGRVRSRTTWKFLVQHWTNIERLHLILVDTFA